MPAVINIIQGDIIMSFEFIRKLPTPTDIKRDFPVPERVAELKKERDKEIADVITGRSDKFLAIIGKTQISLKKSVTFPKQLRSFRILSARSLLTKI